MSSNKFTMGAKLTKKVNNITVTENQFSLSAHLSLHLSLQLRQQSSLIPKIRDSVGHQERHVQTSQETEVLSKQPAPKVDFNLIPGKDLTL